MRTKPFFGLEDRFYWWAFSTAYHHEFARDQDPCRRFARAIVLSSKPVTASVVAEWQRIMGKIEQMNMAGKSRAEQCAMVAQELDLVLEDCK